LKRETASEMSKTAHVTHSFRAVNHTLHDFAFCTKYETKLLFVGSHPGIILS
jgi:hypothetical protein